jgi:hypothetical protein
MNWKHLPVVLLAGTILVVGTTTAPAHGLRSGSCAPVASECAMPCAPAPAPVMQKVMVTEYQREEYDTTVKVWKTFTKEEKYTAYKCEVVPVARKVMVTHYVTVPKVVERVVTRCEMQPVTVEVPVTRCVMVPTEEERTVIRCEYVPTVEEREVTRYEAKTTPVTSYVNRCVDKGGHYECREVACSTGGGRHGLFHRRHEDCDCPPPVSLVSVYVPNYVTEQVPVTTYQTVCVPVKERVKVTVYQRVEKPEKIKVTVCRLQEIKETVKVTRCQLIERKETVKVTVYECMPQTKEETITVCESKMTPYEMTRTVCYTAPTEEKVKAVRYIPKTVEKEIAVYPTTCASPCGDNYGSDCGGRRHGLFRH